MIKLGTHFLVFATLSGCAHLSGSGNGSEQRATVWNEAQEALWQEDYTGAAERFGYLRESYPGTIEGRESLFYLGAIFLDPRNPEWDSGPAEEHFAEYLGMISQNGPRLYRYPEAKTLHEIARQLNLPAESRVAALQPEERVVRVQERVVVPASETRELTAEVSRLRERLAASDARIREQEAELERIRRTLTPSRQ